MKKILFKSILFLCFLVVGVKAYDYNDAPPPLVPVYEPEDPKYGWDDFSHYDLEDINNLKSGLYVKMSTFLLFLIETEIYNIEHNHEKSKLYEKLADQTIKYIESEYDAVDANRYSSIEDMLKNFENESVSQKLSIAKNVTDLLVKSAKYKNKTIGDAPLSLELRHSNKFASTVLTWRDQSEHVECSGAGIRYVSDGQGGSQQIIDYWTDNYIVTPRYTIYRVIDGVEVKIATYKQKNIHKGRGVDISFNISQLSDHITSNLRSIFSMFSDKDEVNNGTLIYIDNFSEQSLNIGNRVSYKVKADMKYVDIHRFLGEKVYTCGHNRSYETSKNYIDYDADGYVDFAPRRFSWLIPVLFNMLY